jgi:ABC-2 type transport system permease protein
MIGRIWGLAVKECIQLVRDRLMAFFIFLFPVTQLVLLATVAGHGITDLPLAVLDLDRSSDSRAAIQAMDNTPDLKWTYQAANDAELADLVARGKAVVGVTIPPGFSEAVVAHKVPTLQVLVDATNATVGSTAQGAVEGALTEYVRRQLAAAGFPTTAPIDLSTAIRYNNELNARLFTIPAQIGFIIYQVTLAISSLTFARERELGTLEQLLVTPLRRFEVLTGKAVLVWLIGLLDFLLMYWVVVALFGIPMRGSFVLLLGLSMLFVAVEIAYGVVVSSISKTQQQAIMYVFMLAMTDVALSGYLVPVQNMPALFKWLAYFSPLQHFLIIVRSIMLKGADLAVLWPHALGLLGIGVVVGGTALAAIRNLE